MHSSSQKIVFEILKGAISLIGNYIISKKNT